MLKRYPSALSLLLAALVLLPGTSALGFGAKGHRAIGALAEQHLNEAAAEAVQDLLQGESLASASTWADRMRSSTDNTRFWGYDYAANWHFANTLPGRGYEQSPKSEHGDAYTALAAFLAILRGENVPAGPVREGLSLYFGDLQAPENQPALRRFALRFVLHLVGDLHQPLHLGYEEDRGGNEVDVRWFGQDSNLHRVWDSQLLDYRDYNAHELSELLQERIDALPSREVAALQQGEPLDWMNDTLPLRQDIYAVQRYQGDLGKDYAQRFVPMLEAQVLRAGLRLAELLNRLFSSPPADMN